MLKLVPDNKKPLRKTKDLTDKDLYLCEIYINIENIAQEKVIKGEQQYVLGLASALLTIENMLGINNAGGIDWEDIKKAPMRK
jgi:hypothetical protein